MKRGISILLFGIIICIIGTACQKSGWDLDKMLQQGKYDEVITLGEKKLAENPEDYGTMIIIGDAYYLKGLKFNEDAGVAYSAEAAALARQATEYYRQSKKYHESMRVEQKLGFASALMSPP